MAVTIRQSKQCTGASVAALALNSAPIDDGKGVLLVAIVRRGNQLPGINATGSGVGTPYTLLNPGGSYARQGYLGHASDESGDDGYVTLYAKAVESTDPNVTINSGGASTLRAQFRFYEIRGSGSGATLLANAIVLAQSRGTAPSVTDIDLGNFADATGVAVMATVVPRGSDQAPDAITQAFDVAWTERYDNQIDPGSAGPSAGIADATPSGSDLDPQDTLTVTNGGQSVPEWAAAAVLFSDAPGLACGFSATPLSGPVELEVDFTDTTTGDPDGWLWDFGDGDTSTDQNPSHTYTVPGDYTVSLTVTRSSDDAECDTSITAYIHVGIRAAGVFVDWDNDGFEQATADEISGTPQNVAKWIIHRGASAEITGAGEPGTATLTLKNPDDIYNPRNESSPLTGLLRDGAPVWIGPNVDGALTGDDPRGLFGGRITDITPIPAGGASDSPMVEIACEDMLSWARRTPVQLDYAEGRSHQDLRVAALIAAGETRYDLAHEIHTMPLSHADGDLASVLEAINAVNGTRHWAKPEDAVSDWFTYTTRNRFWRLDGTTSDAALSAADEHVTDTDGWRLSADTVINRQKATVTPIVFTPGTFTVWQAESLPFNLSPERPFVRIVEFDDVVRDPVLDLASTGDTVISTFTPFATAAKIELSVAPGDAATIMALSVEGRLARRLPDESYTADDTASQAAPRGVREGGQIGNEYLGVIASARGIAQHAVWRYGNPQLRPTLTVVNWLPDQFDLDLYDVIAFTSPQLKMDARLFEIVGLTHEAILAASADLHSHTTTYVLQESRLQEAADWFILDDDPGSLLDDGVSLLHY